MQQKLISIKKFQYFSLCIFLVVFFSLQSTTIYATHVRAGDLTAERLSTSALTYKFTATVYTDDAGVPPDPEIEFDFGTGDQAFYPRVSAVPVGNATTKNIYEAIYTFPGPGMYKVGVIIRNRNSNILNIPNSVNTAFYIESSFLINPFLGLNTSPILLVPPIDFAARGRIYIHNPGAYDADGDSLAYRMVICKRSQGQDVDGYRDPSDPAFNGFKFDTGGPATLTLDPYVGDLIWDTPGEPGQYNVAFIVEEWRGGVLIGEVNRDMQIIVRENPNFPPILNELDTCVIAGATINADVIATDSDGDKIKLTSYSMLYDPPGILTPPSHFAGFSVNPQAEGLQTGVFSWKTECEDVRRLPYTVTFKAEDERSPFFEKLVDLSTWRIRVIGPPPENLGVEPNALEAGIQLNWDPYTCSNATKMAIYRRVGPFEFDPYPCTTGLPGFTGYVKIAEVPISQRNYYDQNGGAGLPRGATYCYRLVAIFPEPGGGESMTSEEACAFLPTVAPYLLNVSIEQTDPSNGEVFVRWSKPINPDLESFPRPHTYELWGAEGASGSNGFIQLGEVFAENDTFFLHSSVNTEDLSWRYRVYMFSNGVKVDSSLVASSVRLSITSLENGFTLSWTATTPWSNTPSSFPYHYIYRKKEGDLSYTLIDSVLSAASGMQYTDTSPALLPETKYCYRIETMGSYSQAGLPEPLRNFSQEVCGYLKDFDPPCEPILSFSLSLPDCSDTDALLNQYCDREVFSNTLIWSPQLLGTCDWNQVVYRLYFSEHQGEERQLLVETQDTLFVHEQTNSFAGCYQLEVEDPSANISKSEVICIDNCPYYELPNVLTPNGDGYNDTFIPLPCPLFVREVHFTIYNRWGKRIYKSVDDGSLDWKGIDDKGKELPSGVYYYEAEVYFNRLNSEEELKTMKGWIHLLR